MIFDREWVNHRTESAVCEPVVQQDPPVGCQVVNFEKIHTSLENIKSQLPQIIRQPLKQEMGRRSIGYQRDLCLVQKLFCWHVSATRC